ncbi:putative NBS resistance protein [Trifolium pratense]|uniref:Putative NBS resistance protein n=1 Tax=Trifolium pratense TaxID=57577 RepID=A0A2K3P638_TRIPR|nr:putative NBS resistance protein [Trifolium pratense]
MHLAWSIGSMNLMPSVLRLSKWTNDFKSCTQRQRHAQILIRLIELPQEYWRQRTLFEIASVIGTPLSLHESTKNRAFEHYGRILVDMDLSWRVFDVIRVERDGYAFNLEIVYEHLPSYCFHCGILGHDVTNCQRLQELKPVDNGMKRSEPVKQKKQYAAKPTTTQIESSIPRVETVTAAPVFNETNTNPAEKLVNAAQVVVHQQHDLVHAQNFGDNQLSVETSTNTLAATSHKPAAVSTSSDRQYDNIIVLEPLI